MNDQGTTVDLHVKILDREVVRRAKACGIDVLVYAPHFTHLPDIAARAARFSDDDLLVVPAREVFTGPWRDRKHVLAVGLAEPVPDFITLDAAMSEFERQDAAVLVPHPEFLTVGLTAEDIGAHADRIHAVETYNPKHLARHNRRAREIAGTTEILAFASSYAHLRTTVGEAWTAFDARIETASDLVEALVSGVPRRVEHRRGGPHMFRCAAEFAHLGWENSWKKADRVFLSGLEATHPNQPVYDGRFDDASVY